MNQAEKKKPISMPVKYPAAMRGGENPRSLTPEEFKDAVANIQQRNRDRMKQILGHPKRAGAL